MKKYLYHLQKVSTIRFILELGLIAFLIKIPAGIVGALVVQSFGIHEAGLLASQQEPILTWSDTFFAVGIAPIIETLLGQFLPIQIGGRFVKNERFLILLSATLFMLLHFPVVEFFPSAFMIGLILGWAWMVKRKGGVREAFVIVMLIHALHNALVTLFASLFQ